MSFHYSENRFDFLCCHFRVYSYPLIFWSGRSGKSGGIHQTIMFIGFQPPDFFRIILMISRARPTFRGNSVFYVSLFALLLAISVSIQSGNKARNYPVAALPARAEVSNILLSDCINNYSLRHLV